MSFKYVHVKNIFNNFNVSPAISLVQVPIFFHHRLLTSLPTSLQPFSTLQPKWFFKSTSLILSLACLKAINTPSPLRIKAKPCNLIDIVLYAQASTHPCGLTSHCLLSSCSTLLSSPYFLAPSTSNSADMLFLLLEILSSPCFHPCLARCPLHLGLIHLIIVSSEKPSTLLSLGSVTRLFFPEHLCLPYSVAHLSLTQLL